MNFIRRFGNILLALIMIAGAILIMCIPSLGYFIILSIIVLSLIVKGVGYFVYYFSLARHMVGGSKELVFGLIFLDLGLYLASKINVPSNLVMMYLAVIIAIEAGINVFRTVELKKNGAPSWKLKMFYSVYLIGLVVMCNAFAESLEILTIVYGIWLLGSAAFKIYTSVRKTALTYVA